MAGDDEGALASQTSFDYSIYNAIYWLVFLMGLSWLLRIYGRCRHAHLLYQALRTHQLVRLDAGFEIRAHEMTRATLQALLKNRSRYDQRTVAKYKPAAHVQRETARLVPITSEPAPNTVEPASTMVSSLVPSSTKSQIGDYQLHLRISVANPVMVHVYMGVAQSSLRTMFTKYDPIHEVDDSNEKSTGTRVSDGVGAGAGIRQRGKGSTEAKSSVIRPVIVRQQQQQSSDSQEDDIKVSMTSAAPTVTPPTQPLFGTSEYLFTMSKRVVPSTASIDISMILPREWFVRCLSSFETGVRQPLVIHISPLSDTMSMNTSPHSRHVPTPHASLHGNGGPTPSANHISVLDKSRPTTPTRPSLSDHGTDSHRPSPPSTPLGWEPSHATASEIIIVNFPPLPSPPSATSPLAASTSPVSQPSAAAAAAATPSINNNIHNNSAASSSSSSTTSAADMVTSGNGTDSKVRSPVQQAIANSLDLLVSRAKFDRQLLLVDGLLYDVQEIYGLNEETLDCSICMSNPRDIILLPCRHCCVCATCHTKTDKCPVCRSVILNYMQFDATPTGARAAAASKEYPHNGTHGSHGTPRIS